MKILWWWAALFIAVFAMMIDRHKYQAAAVYAFSAIMAMLALIALQTDRK